jgi:hypothetical protein
MRTFVNITMYTSATIIEKERKNCEGQKTREI